ncbi:MAG: 6-phosphofructokinase [Oscillospiraceae bacterium]|nr:6-phosphofructokinase [Oscillospiraceae bacterium]
MRKIGVLTSGGDAPGMNAAVRAVTRAGISKGYEVIGIKRGFNGLINVEGKESRETMDAKIKELGVRDVSNIIHTGGTILYTARCLEFKEQHYISQAKIRCDELGLVGVVVIGGDGSFRGARDLSLEGVPCVGIPGTIDNDIYCTEYTIGYDTAMNTAMQMVDKLRDTAQSHDRCSVVEVMGRRAGWIALNVGLAVGAMAAITTEMPYDINEVADKIMKSKENGKQHFIIIVSEGVGDADGIAKKIEELTGIESRATILGHVQRGGSPTVRDRVNASKLGYNAVELLDEGKGNRVVAMKGGKVVDFDILEALSKKRKQFDKRLYDISRVISM